MIVKTDRVNKSNKPRRRRQTPYVKANEVGKDEILDPNPYLVRSSLSTGYLQERQASSRTRLPPSTIAGDKRLQTSLSFGTVISSTRPSRARIAYRQRKPLYYPYSDYTRSVNNCFWNQDRSVMENGNCSRKSVIYGSHQQMTAPVVVETDQRRQRGLNACAKNGGQLVEVNQSVAMNGPSRMAVRMTSDEDMSNTCLPCVGMSVATCSDSLGHSTTSAQSQQYGSNCTDCKAENEHLAEANNQRMEATYIVTSPVFCAFVKDTLGINVKPNVRPVGSQSPNHNNLSQTPTRNNHSSTKNATAVDSAQNFSQNAYPVSATPSCDVSIEAASEFEQTIITRPTAARVVASGTIFHSSILYPNDMQANEGNKNVESVKRSEHGGSPVSYLPLKTFCMDESNRPTSMNRSRSVPPRMENASKNSVIYDNESNNILHSNRPNVSLSNKPLRQRELYSIVTKERRKYAEEKYVSQQESESRQQVESCDVSTKTFEKQSRPARHNVSDMLKLESSNRSDTNEGIEQKKNFITKSDVTVVSKIISPSNPYHVNASTSGQTKSKNSVLNSTDVRSCNVKDDKSNSSNWRRSKIASDIFTEETKPVTLKKNEITANGYGIANAIPLKNKVNQFESIMSGVKKSKLETIRRIQEEDQVSEIDYPIIATKDNTDKKEGTDYKLSSEEKNASHQLSAATAKQSLAQRKASTLTEDNRDWNSKKRSAYRARNEYHRLEANTPRFTDNREWIDEECEDHRDSKIFKSLKQDISLEKDNRDWNLGKRSTYKACQEYCSFPMADCSRCINNREWLGTECEDDDKDAKVRTAQTQTGEIKLKQLPNMNAKHKENLLTTNYSTNCKQTQCYSRELPEYDIIKHDVGQNCRISQAQVQMIISGKKESKQINGKSTFTASSVDNAMSKYANDVKQSEQERRPVETLRKTSKKKLNDQRCMTANERNNIGLRSKLSDNSTSSTNSSIKTLSKRSCRPTTVEIYSNKLEDNNDHKYDCSDGEAEESDANDLKKYAKRMNGSLVSNKPNKKGGCKIEIRQKLSKYMEDKQNPSVSNPSNSSITHQETFEKIIYKKNAIGKDNEEVEYDEEQKSEKDESSDSSLSEGESENEALYYNNQKDTVCNGLTSKTNGRRSQCDVEKEQISKNGSFSNRSSNKDCLSHQENTSVIDNIRCNTQIASSAKQSVKQAEQVVEKACSKEKISRITSGSVNYSEKWVRWKDFNYEQDEIVKDIDSHFHSSEKNVVAMEIADRTYQQFPMESDAGRVNRSYEQVPAVCDAGKVYASYQKASNENDLGSVNESYQQVPAENVTDSTYKSYQQVPAESDMGRVNRSYQQVPMEIEAKKVQQVPAANDVGKLSRLYQQSKSLVESDEGKVNRLHQQALVECNAERQSRVYQPTPVVYNAGRVSGTQLLTSVESDAGKLNKSNQKQASVHNDACKDLVTHMKRDTILNDFDDCGELDDYMANEIKPTYVKNDDNVDAQIEDLLKD